MHAVFSQRQSSAEHACRSVNGQKTTTASPFVLFNSECKAGRPNAPQRQWKEEMLNNKQRDTCNKASGKTKPACRHFLPACMPLIVGWRQQGDNPLLCSGGETLWRNRRRNHCCKERQSQLTREGGESFNKRKQEREATDRLHFRFFFSSFSVHNSQGKKRKRERENHRLTDRPARPSASVAQARFGAR